eukprot:gene539-8051_t
MKKYMDNSFRSEMYEFLVQMDDEENGPQAAIISPYSSELSKNLPNSNIVLITNENGLLGRRTKNIQQAAYGILSSYKNCNILLNRYITKVEENENTKEEIDEFIEDDVNINSLYSKGFSSNRSSGRSGESNSDKNSPKTSLSRRESMLHLNFYSNIFAIGDIIIRLKRN